VPSGPERTSAAHVPAILTFSTWPAYAWLERRLRHRPSLAALVMTLLLALAFILPLVLIATTLADAVTLVADGLRSLLERGPPPPPDWVARLPGVGPELLAFWRQLASDTAEFAEFVRSYLLGTRSYALDLAVAIGGAVLELSLSVFAAFFFYRGGIEVVDQIRGIGQRVVGERVHHLLLVTSSTICGVAYALLLDWGRAPEASVAGEPYRAQV
jgi:predicted PurR-regulated permease PerM